MIPSRKLTRIFLLLSAILISSFLLTACNTQVQTGGSYASVPVGLAYAEGKEIYFSHTEASDAAVAEKLTNMMKSPVLLVPALAQVPPEALATVYVFENGVPDKGPLGFQPDVFDNPPGSDGYSPLRQIVFVKWSEGVSALELKSAADVLKAQTDGQLTLQDSGIVVNMPFMVWDGGKR